MNRTDTLLYVGCGSRLVRGSHLGNGRTLEGGRQEAGANATGKSAPRRTVSGGLFLRAKKARRKVVVPVAVAVGGLC